MKKIILTLAMLTSLSCQASVRMYVTNDDVDDSTDCFHIHTGKNEWVSTQTMYRDKSGLYAKEDELLQISDKELAYKQSWKCPYCYRYYDQGNPCNNADCPSKYRSGGLVND